MNKSHLVLIVFLFMFAYNSLGQEHLITCSTEKVIIHGKKFYVHIVKQGETLYAISRAYNIKEKEIIL